MVLDLIEKKTFHSQVVGLVITFGADVRSSVYVDNKGKGILVLGFDPTQG